MTGLTEDKGVIGRIGVSFTRLILSGVLGGNLDSSVRVEDVRRGESG